MTHYSSLAAGLITHGWHKHIKNHICKHKNRAFFLLLTKIYLSGPIS